VVCNAKQCFARSYARSTGHNLSVNEPVAELVRWLFPNFILELKKDPLVARMSHATKVQVWPRSWLLSYELWCRCVGAVQSRGFFFDSLLSKMPGGCLTSRISSFFFAVRAKSSVYYRFEIISQISSCITILDNTFGCFLKYFYWLLYYEI
jgi:hypothetical protein